MKKMKVVFVEDKPKEIDGVLTILETSKYFELIGPYTDYDLVPAERMRDGDLFVLDVLTHEADDEPFCRFISALRDLQRPFLAFTRMTEHSPLPSLAGHPRLRQTVLEFGGLGCLSKFTGAGQESRLSRKDLELDLAEQIMRFQWVWRLGRSAV